MLRNFLNEFVLDIYGRTNVDVANKFIQFNFDITEKCGGVFLINDVFITFSKNDGYSSVLNLINSVQNFGYTNYHLTHLLYTEIAKGNKIVIERLSTDYTEKNRFINERSNLCNVGAIKDSKKHLLHRKYYYYKCILQRSKFIKVRDSEPFPVTECYLTIDEMNMYNQYNLKGMVKVRKNVSTDKTFFVDSMLYKLFKSERRISIINDIT